MQFHLNYTPSKFDFEINHTHKLFLIGSCFSENINHFLNDYKFKTYTNPNGILFNPISISDCLGTILNNTSVHENVILQREDVYLSYLHHSSINSSNKTLLLEKINTEIVKANTFLKECDFLIITFGSAYAYRHLQLNHTVANCHKQPASNFDKQLIPLNEIITNYSVVIKNLHNFNPKLKIIFSLSPVKYLKDGVIENNLSKSTLTIAIHEIIKQNSNCYYFPAFELVTDDLRDYRFYKEDLAHPNDLAINYIWEKFSTTFFNSITCKLNDHIKKLNQALNHRQMLSGNSEKTKLDSYIAKQKEELKKLHPEIDFN